VADPITILVVDDHAVVREGLRAFLGLQDGFEIVGEAGDGDEALDEAGAAGYLLKNSQPAELARAVRAAHAGEAIIDPTVAARLVHALSKRPAATAFDDLTTRERGVLALIAQGRSNKRIALELGISEKTVKTHVGHVLAKLDVTDRTQAAVLAVQAGLVKRGS